MSGTDAKRPCDFLDVYQGNVFLGSFNHTDIGAMHPCHLPELFLRDATLDPLCADTLAEPGKDVSLLNHIASVGTCYFPFYIL